jgi:hypothetical protein
MGFTPSDSSLWLLWAAAEYVFATRDFGFLDSLHEFYCKAGRGRCGAAVTAYAILKQAYTYQIEQVGTGQHGLIRLKNSDWDDLLTSPFGAFDAQMTIAKGESTLNTALAVVAYPMLAALAERRGDVPFAASVRSAAAALKSTLQGELCKGRDYFSRAYVYGKDGQLLQLGCDNPFLAANGVALIVDSLLTPQQSSALVARMRQAFFDGSTLGLASQGQPIQYDQAGAGFWYSLAGPAVEGLIKQGTPDARALAWDAFRQQTLAMHAETYPNIWYGVWSGPDKYFTPLDATSPDRPGATWCIPLAACMQDFPVTNMFSHSEPLLSSIRMAGLSPTPDGFIIDPSYPFATFKWESRVFAVERTATGLQGKLTAVGDDTLALKVRVNACQEVLAVTANSQPAPFTCERNFVRFQMLVARRKAAQWSVQSASGNP